MSKSIRDVRQEEFAKIWLNGDRKNILNLCPRLFKGMLISFSPTIRKY